MPHNAGGGCCACKKMQRDFIIFVSVAAQNLHGEKVQSFLARKTYFN
jgi:hypothetical protein